ncbi:MULTISPECIES: hypothetical protein [unclassified Paraflavitalea]|uniref:hypothetical protein n=1 Tax=unclassified Paraflavitalea TaxID=2798305 RepID=UPI003D351C1A
MNQLQNLKGKELFSYLKSNKESLIKRKKSIIKHSDAVFYDNSLVTKEGIVVKANFNTPKTIEDTGEVMVKVVANTSLWCDSHMDVLLRDSAKKSMKERKGLIPHLKNHDYTLESELGDVKSIYYEDIALRDLGVNKPGSAQCLIFETNILKSCDEKIYYKYLQGRVKQHSIGLQYMKLELAINDPDSEKEFDFWNKYIEQVINPEVCIERGYFWVVPEYKLIENSAVLFGSNMLTPTLEIGNSNKGIEDESTQFQPPAGTEKESESAFDVMKAIEETTFIKVI